MVQPRQPDHSRTTLYIGAAAANINTSVNGSDEHFENAMTLRIQPAAQFPIPEYTIGDISPAHATLAEERRDILDAVRQALSRSPGTDCLAACVALLRQIEQGSAIM
jgi:hypothetical protein